DARIGMAEHAPRRTHAYGVAKSHLIDNAIDRFFLQPQQPRWCTRHSLGHALHGVVKLITRYRAIGPPDLVRLAPVDTSRGLERVFLCLARTHADREQDVFDATAQRKGGPADLAVVGDDDDVGKTAQDG